MSREKRNYSVEFKEKAVELCYVRRFHINTASNQIKGIGFSNHQSSSFLEITTDTGL